MGLTATPINSPTISVFGRRMGESEKTSIRTSARMGQIVEDGFYTGGSCPYGYKLVRQGRVNKRGHEFMIWSSTRRGSCCPHDFELYVEEGRGAQSIANLLNSRNIKTVPATTGTLPVFAA